MKQVSLILNIVLLILVGLLIYWHFTGNNSPAASTADHSTAADSRNIQIAYVNLDSLQEQYAYIRQERAALESKRSAMENELNADGKALQNEVAQFQQKATTMTQAEGEATQKKLMQKQQQLQQKQENMHQALLDAQEKFQEELQHRLDSFLQQYNADKKYTYILPYSSSVANILYKDNTYDITADVVKGLNAAQNGGKQ